MSDKDKFPSIPKTGENGNSTSQAATERLNQVSSHISPNESKPRKKKQSLKSTTSRLPADYSDVLSQIDSLRAIAARPDPNNRGYIRQKQAGKLWVRERIEQLLDPGSFQEIGSVSGTVKWTKTGPVQEKPEAFVPSNNVQGMGRLRGRQVVLTVDDFSIRGGHADGSTAEKTIYLEKLAVALKLPVVKLVDGSSGGGSVTTIRKAGWSYLPHVPMYKHVVQQLNMGIPNVGAVVGPAVWTLPLDLLVDMILTISDWPWSCESSLMSLLRHGSGHRVTV